MAVVSYLFGGPIADKFPPQKLIASALFLTALGGFVLGTYPSYTTLLLLYGYWGFTTIFLFWAPLIKATRLWGGTLHQGKAFGFLDGGRGLVAASFGLIGVAVFSFFLPENQTSFVINVQQDAFQKVIWLASLLIILVAVLVLFFLQFQNKEANVNVQRITRSLVGEVLKLPSVWWLMLIILCAYFGYKTTDMFSLYARDVMKLNEVKAAGVGTSMLYVRPIIGVCVGLLADRSKPSFWLQIGFCLTIVSAGIFALGLLSHTSFLAFIIGTLCVAIGVYTTRVLYFALLEESNIPLVWSGTAIGLISVVGYTPDIFAGPLMGYFLDTFTGKLGHQYVFLCLVGFSFIGF